MCPVACLLEYLARTEPFRKSVGSKSTVSCSALTSFSCFYYYYFKVAQGVTCFLWGGLQVVFLAIPPGLHPHLLLERLVHVSLDVVIAAADWHGPSTFIKHYYRPRALSQFTSAVLSAQDTNHSQ